MMVTNWIFCIPEQCHGLLVEQETDKCGILVLQLRIHHYEAVL